jgi:adenosylhomocysteine nucleosidase
MIGIIGAMAVEVEEILEQMEQDKTETFSGITYHTGRISGGECVVAQCGVGKVAAAVCAQTMILRYSPSALINVGVAGGIGKEIHIGDIVVSSALVQHDMDTSALGDPKGYISGLGIVELPADAPLAAAVREAALSVYPEEKIHNGIIASGDQFISGAEKLNRIAEEFGASACEMEGGSIAQVCAMNKTGFVVIRSISDNANDSAAVDFTRFAAESAHLLTRLICAALPKL